MQPAATGAPRTTTTYVHYTSPSAATTRTVSTTTPTPAQLPTTVAPKDVTFKSYTPQPQPTASTSQPRLQTTVAPSSTVNTPAPVPAPVPSSSTSTSTPATSTSSVPANGITAQGDWTKDLVHLAKTAELKKHALTLQLHTAHILSSHALLEQKSKAIQDVKEQKNKLDSERARLLESLRQVNEDRDKVDMLQVGIEKECTELRTKILQISEGEYAKAKLQVDKLRQELGQTPLPSLQSMMDEKTSQYLNERRLNAVPAPANTNGTDINANNKRPAPAPAAASTSTIGADGQPQGKRPRGRPKGSKNRKGSG
ncbi:hypothetical protein VNI00_014121 [Paramarasmius palmivorus]|uniref:Uncharacterized protein n=1 Tax=Paramarasmius palmivorus TaxID=297713 RepID=A0AAW0BUG3_9AGAR